MHQEVEELPTRAEVIEALGHANFRAKRLPRVVGLPGPATPWDRSHAHVNDLLDKLEFASATWGP